MRPAVFLDRDGTMIHEVGYLSRLEDLRWFPWTIDAIRLLNRAGFVVCVTTNQGGIGLGFFTEDFVAELHGEMSADARRGGRARRRLVLLSASPARDVEALRVDCDCRKPRPGHDSRRRTSVSASISRGRSSSATSWPTSDWRRASARAASWCGPATATRKLVRHGGNVPGAAYVAE